MCIHRQRQHHKHQAQGKEVEVEVEVEEGLLSLEEVEEEMHNSNYRL